MMIVVVSVRINITDEDKTQAETLGFAIVELARKAISDVVYDVCDVIEVTAQTVVDEPKVEEKVEEKKPAYDNVKCPECGGDMVSRKGQFGTFWGCKKYPSCRGTRDSQGRSKADRDAEKALPVKPISRWSGI